MHNNKRSITYGQAIQEALCQAMARDKDVFVFGIGVTDYKGIFGTTTEISDKYPDRVIETPASENALTGIAIGAAITGKKPVLVHARNDFMFLALDQMINAASKWRYMFNGRSKAPFLVRAIIGKGWGQGPTHSQSIQSIFMHFPGYYAAMPSTPYDMKGLMLGALELDSPSIIFEHRSLYNNSGYVPATYYTEDFGKARVVLPGKDITIVAVSLMVQEAVKAALALKKMGISAEVVDPRTIVPLDVKTIVKSVAKTGRVIIADTSWVHAGFASEVSACIAETVVGKLRSPVKRIGMANCPAPVSKPLEESFYPNYKDIFTDACVMIGKKPDLRLIKDDIIDKFTGPY